MSDIKKLWVSTDEIMELQFADREDSFRIGVLEIDKKLMKME